MKTEINIRRVENGYIVKSDGVFKDQELVFEKLEHALALVAIRLDPYNDYSMMVKFQATKEIE